ncbi:hypothetical protein CBR_g49251 [Chara braunii]|uniref:CCHC-type domain-containing protein n=1 Tax=Chara braunii TaxID=69332 RepID=A0A388M4E8_CHABU|nr:hypothetical protein CBR_g49251 [Chara braunii]|eukprot:GBG89460.1 hypothetical protein CBR_g49251 [Chara braunii]
MGPLTPQARLAQAARTRNQAKASASQEPPHREPEPGRRKEVVEVEDDDDEEEEDERLRQEEDQRAEQRAKKKEAREETEPILRDVPPRKKKYAVRLEEVFDVEKVIARLLEGHNDLMTLKEILASAFKLRDGLKGRLSRRLVPNVHLGTILPKEAEWAESGTKMDWKCVACGTLDLVVKGSKCTTMVDTGAEMNIIREADDIKFALDIDRSDCGVLHGASCRAVFCGTTSNVFIEVGKVKVRACFFVMPDVDHGILLGRSFFSRTKTVIFNKHDGTLILLLCDSACGNYEVITCRNTGPKSIRNRPNSESFTIEESEGERRRLRAEREEEERVEAFSLSLSDVGKAMDMVAAHEMTDPDAIRALREKVLECPEPGRLELVYRLPDGRRKPALMQAQSWVQDLQRLNAVTVRDVGGLPNADALSESCVGRPIISLIDLYAGYDQFPVYPLDKPVTAMHTPRGLIHMNVAPQGWTNAAAMVQRAMIRVMQSVSPHITQPYIDDLAVKGPPVKESDEVLPGVRRFVWKHIQNLEKVLTLLEEHNLKASGAKSRHCMREATILEFVCSEKGRRLDIKKTDKITEWPVPFHSITDVRRFLRTCGFRRAFVKNFAAKTEHLRKLVHQDQEWFWGEEQEEVVARMKEEFREGGLVLVAPDYHATEIRPFIVETDAGPTASDFTKTTMPRGGKGTRPPWRPLGASGGYERHGPRHRESTPEYDGGDVELFLDSFWEHARRMGWTVTQEIERLRGVDRFKGPVAQIRREATTTSEVEMRMQELKAERPLARQVRDMARDWESCRAHLSEAFRRPESPRPRVERRQRSRRQRDPEPSEARPSRGGRKALARREEEAEPDDEERGAYPEYGLGPVEFHRSTESGLRRSPARTQEEPPTSEEPLRELEAHLDISRWRVSPRQIPKRVHLRTRERAPTGETDEEKRVRRTMRIEEIWQERPRLEAAGALPGQPPSEPARSPEIPEMWRDFWEQRGKELPSPTRAGFGVARKAEERLDRKIKFLAKTTFDRHLLLDSDLAGKKTKEEGHGVRLEAMEVEIQELRESVASQAVIIESLRQQTQGKVDKPESSRQREQRQPGHGLPGQSSAAEPRQEPPMGRVIVELEEARAKREAEREAFEFRAPTELATLPVAAADPVVLLAVEEGLPPSSSESDQGSAEGPLDVLLEAVHSMQDEASLFSPGQKIDEPLEREMGIEAEGVIEGGLQRLSTPEYGPEGIEDRPGPNTQQVETGEKPLDMPQSHELSREASEAPSSSGSRRGKKRSRKWFDTSCFFCTKEGHRVLQCPKFLKDKAEGKVTEEGGRMYDRQGKMVERSADGGRAQLYRQNEEEMSDQD